MTSIDVKSIREQTFKHLDKNHELRAKDLCTLMVLDFKSHGHTLRQYRSDWKRQYRQRNALSCLSFHKVRGWVCALKSMDRSRACECHVDNRITWKATRALNGMLLFKDSELGRLEWFQTGRVNIWLKKPGTRARLKQLLAKGFVWTGLIQDIELFELWSNQARFKGAHLVQDLGEKLPYSRIDFLKDSLGVVVKTGDVTHSTCVEIEFCYPDWQERTERALDEAKKTIEVDSRVLEHNAKAFELDSKMFQENSKAIGQLTTVMQDLNVTKTPAKPDRTMVV